MNLGRREKGGEALVVFSTDSMVDDATIAQITEAIQPDYIRAVKLPK